LSKQKLTRSCRDKEEEEELLGSWLKQWNLLEEEECHFIETGHQTQQCSTQWIVIYCTAITANN
jgi:hypothetical protein